MMDLDYIQKYEFSKNGGGIPLRNYVDANILSTSLLQGGGIDIHLSVPGGLIYKNSADETEYGLYLEEDPWEIEVRDDFDSFLDLVSYRPSKQKISLKMKKIIPKLKKTKKERK